MTRPFFKTYISTYFMLIVPKIFLRIVLKNDTFVEIFGIIESKYYFDTLFFLQKKYIFVCRESV